MLPAALSVLILIGVSAPWAGSPSYLWTRAAGDFVSDYVGSVATDASGNVYMTGSYLGGISFGGDSLLSVTRSGGFILYGSHDFYLAKLDGSGGHVWSRSHGGDQTDFGRAMVVDPSGDVVVAGEFSPPASFGGATFTTGSIFLAKYSGATGAPVWSLATGISTYPSLVWVTGLACDATGNLFLTGYFQGTVNIAAADLVSAGSYDMFVVKYSAAGGVLWVQRFGDNGADTCEDVAIDASGNVVITGRFQNSIDFGGGTVFGNGVFLVKLSTTGTHVWTRAFGGTSGHGVAVDATNHIVLAGDFSGTASFGGPPVVGSVGNENVFLARYDADGNHVWSRGFPGNGHDHAAGAAVDANGNIALTGYFGYFVGVSGYTIDFDGTTLVSAGEGDGFVALFDVSGASLWAARFGNQQLDSGEDVAMDPEGNVVAGGYFRQSIGFLGQTFPSRGLEDVFVAKFAPEIAELAILDVRDIGNDQGRQVKIAFGRSGLDGPGRSVPVIRYDAYRRDDPPPSAGPAEDASASDVPGSGISAGGTPSASVRAPLEENWQYVASVPAHGEPEYLIRASTLGDSTLAGGAYYSAFFIRAVTEHVFSFFDSPVDSGYSVDNLAPGVPGSLMYDAGKLSWVASSDDDFDHFTVYGSSRETLDHAAVVISYTADTALDVTDSPYRHYFVTAFDRAGNESPPARVDGDPEPPGDAPRRYALSVRAYPNPFNPETAIAYTVPSRGIVNVTIFDAAGRRVATLVQNEARDAGAYTERWTGRTHTGRPVGSGVYFVRIEHNDVARTCKLVLLK